jgi:hypothetical protein
MYCTNVLRKKIVTPHTQFENPGFVTMLVALCLLATCTMIRSILQGKKGLILLEKDSLF